MCALCQQLGIDFHKLSAGVTDGAADGSSAAWAALPGGSGADAEGPGSDTVVGSTGTSSTMSGGTSVRGYINTNGDQDWYRVTLTAGHHYTFALSGFGSGALSDAYLRLLNSSGTQIAFDDDSGPLPNSKLTFTASTSGTYYISAEGYGGTTTGQYLSDHGNRHDALYADRQHQRHRRLSDQQLLGSERLGRPPLGRRARSPINVHGPQPRIARRWREWRSSSGRMSPISRSSRRAARANIMLDDTQSGAYCILELRRQGHHHVVEHQRRDDMVRWQQRDRQLHAADLHP